MGIGSVELTNALATLYNFRGLPYTYKDLNIVLKLLQRLHHILPEISEDFRPIEHIDGQCPADQNIAHNGS